MHDRKHLIIDCQVHAYERDHPARPWIGTLQGPAQVTGHDMVEAMDSVGVDGALLVSPYSMYRFDASYALEVYADHPNRFGLIKPFDPSSPSVAEQIAEWAGTAGVVGARVMLDRTASDRAGLDTVFRACAEHVLPLNVLAWGKLALLDELAKAHSTTRIVIDHLGLKQPFDPPPPANPFAELNAVLCLARYQNVAIKVSGACTLSHEAFPYQDIWPPLLRTFEAFGLERCLWGTDWTRAVNLLSYEQGVQAFTTSNALSDSDRAMLMGGSLSRIYAWAPTG